MSLSTALNIARSGLGVTAAQADIVSRNISNAETKGYARKVAQQVTDKNGGVQIATVNRQVDELLDKLNRSNISRLSGQQTVADGMKAYTDYLGQPADEISPLSTLSTMKSAFVILSGNVSDSSSQLSVVTAAEGMADHLRTLSGTLSTIGQEVEMNIRYDVADLNTALDRVATLNGLILASQPGSVRVAEFRDEMARSLETISGVMDIQTLTDRNGMVIVTTGGGTELVKGNTAAPVVYTAGTGRLTAGDVDITPGAGNRAFSSGSLHGLYELKTVTLPTFNAQLDASAAALIEGFERVAPLGTAGMGLFTDAGSPFDATNISGIAARIRINTEVNPEAGGNPILLQQGMNATRPPGDTSVVSAMLDVFDQPVQIPTGSLGPASLIGFTTAMVSSQQQRRAEAQSVAAASATAAATVSASRENLQGVDIDDELQRLILIEKSYAANSKVLTSVAQMLDTLINAV